MGRFSTTVHVKNNVDRMRFVNTFSDVMKKRGFVPCSEDEAARSYLFAFGESWVTLANEEYRDNPQKAYDDTREMAAALKTGAFSVEVVDSDFATLTLNNGDCVIVGDGSGYGIEEPERGTRECWEPVLADGKTWEVFSETVEKDGVFVEDTLGELAVVLGMDSYYICADFDDVSEKADGGNNVTAFYFKKATAKAKAMSLNAAFVKVFGEALEPLGFKKIKGQQPYFVRVIGDELLHAITYRQLSSPKSHYKCIEIQGGVATVYRKDLDFPLGEMPTVHRFFVEFSELNVDESVMRNILQFQSNMSEEEIAAINDCEKLRHKFSSNIISFLCKSDDIDEMLQGIENALCATKNVILPVLDKITDITACVEFLYRVQWQSIVLDTFDKFIENERYSRSDALAMIKAGYRGDMLKKRIKKEQMKTEQLIAEHRCGYTQEEFERTCKEQNEDALREIAIRDELIDNPELNKMAFDELERRKLVNTKKLKTYEIIL